jgi:TRAP transporter T-component
VVTSKKTRRNPIGITVFCLALFIAGAVSGCRNRSSDTSRTGAVVSDKTTADRITEADALYSQREDLSKVRLGIAVLWQARIADEGNYEVAWKLAKLNYYLGLHSTDERERDSAFREGVDTGKIAVQLQDDKADGHFWLGANYGGSAEFSVLAGLANFQDIRREMETVVQIDERYEGGSAYMALGQLYLKSPKILGGDNQKAVDYLEKGLRFGGNNSLLRLHLAEAYHALHRDQETRKQIDFILKMTPDPNYLPEYKETVEQAKKLEEKIA